MSAKPTIVLIEDSPTQAQEFSAHLSDLGVDVRIADDGPQGLRFVNEQQTDAVVLDVNLPTMNGHQVCQRLKRDPATAGIPIIMVTSDDGSDDTLRGLASGADDYIPKDAFVTENLISTLKAMGLIGQE